MPEIIDIIMPESEEGTESVVETWFKQPGEAVKEHEPLLEINTDKVTMEIPAPADGVLEEILIEANQPVQPGDLLGRIRIGAVESVSAPQSAATAPGEEKHPALSRKPETVAGFSPLVKRMLKMHRLDPAKITGTGRGARITARDVERYLAGQAEQQAQPPELAGRMVPHSPTRRRIAEHMVQSLLKTAPHVTAVFDADFSAILAHRKKHKEQFAEQGVHLTLTAYFVMAAVEAVKAVPEANSRWHDEALEIFEHCHIGIAAATESGLVVPVIHHAEQLDLQGVARRLQDLTERARQGKLNRRDVQKGTFTITNHGVSGSLIATPVINQPQSAILGIGKLEKRVIVEEDDGVDKMMIKPMAYVSLTIDHRVLDGFQANRFLTRFVDYLKEWK